jgi:3-hydroxyisobutyrate dehydrogenase-like beta-hydroxyacid dehydrogenase
MLANPDAVEEVALRANGFLNYLRPNALWIDCSSVNRSFSKKMTAAAAAQQIHFIDTPVTGSAEAAVEGQLVFWVGGEDADLETIRSLLLCMSNKIVHVGGHGMGTSLKMVINLLMGNAMAAFAEGGRWVKGLESRANYCLIHCSACLRSRHLSQRNGRNRKLELRP